MVRTTSHYRDVTPTPQSPAWELPTGYIAGRAGWMSQPVASASCPARYPLPDANVKLVGVVVSVGIHTLLPGYAPVGANQLAVRRSPYQAEVMSARLAPHCLGIAPLLLRGEGVRRGCQSEWNQGDGGRATDAADRVYGWVARAAGLPAAGSHRRRARTPWPRAVIHDKPAAA